MALMCLVVVAVVAHRYGGEVYLLFTHTITLWFFCVAFCDAVV